MKEIYIEVCRQIKEVSQYVEWLEMGGEEMYGSLSVAKAWYQSLMIFAGDILTAAIG